MMRASHTNVLYMSLNSYHNTQSMFEGSAEPPLMVMSTLPLPLRPEVCKILALALDFAALVAVD